jgi:hypothetical protein
MKVVNNNTLNIFHNICTIKLKTFWFLRMFLYSVPSADVNLPRIRMVHHAKHFRPVEEYLETCSSLTTKCSCPKQGKSAGNFIDQQV